MGSNSLERQRDRAREGEEERGVRVKREKTERRGGIKRGQHNRTQKRRRDRKKRNFISCE